MMNRQPRLLQHPICSLGAIILLTVSVLAGCDSTAVSPDAQQNVLTKDSAFPFSKGGSEPVVPADLWDENRDAERPSMFGLRFHKAHGFYGLHMWVGLHNPEDVFAFEHPKVSCEFYDA